MTRWAAASLPDGICSIGTTTAGTSYDHIFATLEGVITAVEVVDGGLASIGADACICDGTIWISPTQPTFAMLSDENVV